MEYWKDIPGYVGIYQASYDGRIRSAPGKTTSNARYAERKWQTRVLKPKILTKGKRKDLRVSLWKNGEESTQLVARLVALTWCEGYAPGLTVNHIDGNPLNNSADNLEWVTLSENIRKGFETGLYDSFSKNVILVSDSGIAVSYRSLSQASTAIGRGKGYVSNCICNGHDIRGTDGCIYSARLEVAQ